MKSYIGFAQIKFILVAIVIAVGGPLFGQTKGSKSADVLDDINLKNSKSYQDSDIRALKTELLVQKAEKQAVEQNKKLLKKYIGTPLEADLRLRMAELYVRRAKSARFFELNHDSNSIASFLPKTVKGNSSRKLITQAIEIYDLIEKKFPEFENIDLVIFNSAMARQQIDRKLDAEKKYWQIVKYHNYSPLVPDAHLAIGEINFERKKFKQSLDHFNAIKKYPDSRVYPYGIYKGAWAYYNLQQADQGLKELEEVVRYGAYVEKNKIDARLDLRKEALRDMTVFFEDVYPSSMSYKYFVKQAGSLDASPFVMRMANLYSVHSRYSDMEVVLNDFISSDKKSLLLPEAYNSRILNFESLKNRNAAIEHSKRFYSLCFSSDWGQVASSNKATKEQKEAYVGCEESVNSTTLKLASKWMKVWKDNKKSNERGKYAEWAEQEFDIYLSRNTKSPKAINARYAYSEMLFNRAKYRKASQQYALVGQYTIDEFNLKAKPTQMAHDARYGAILAIEKDVGKKKWVKDDENLFVDLVREYVKYHPDGKFRLDVEFKIGTIAYDNNRYDEAAGIFKGLGEKYAKSEKGLKSQDLYLDILNIRKNYLGLKTYTTFLLKTEKESKRRKKLKDLYEQSYFLLVQKQEEEKLYAEAISGYKAFAKENSNSHLAPKAWWNAIQLLYKTNDLVGAANSAEVYNKLFPNASNVQDALLKAAQSYEKLGRIAEAANILEQASHKDKKDSFKWKLLAADFRYINGDEAKAKLLYREVASSQEKNQVFKALEKLELIESEKHLSKAHRQSIIDLVNFGKQPEASLAFIKIVKNTFESGDLPNAFKEASMILKMGNEAAQEAKAQARFIQAQILDKEFRDQSLKSSIQRISTVMELKTARLAKAQKAYEATIHYGHPATSVWAMEKMGQMYAAYVFDLKNMPIPKGVPEAELEVFRSEIEKIAFPLEEKTVDTYSQALATAKQLSLHDGTIPRIQAHLDKINMVKRDLRFKTVSNLELILPVRKRGEL